MTRSNWNSSTYDAFEKVINTDLFNAALSLAAATSKNEEAMLLYGRALQNALWGDRDIDQTAYFEAYGLRYFGEILERFAEKFGSERRNLRAVALALGYAAPFLTESMFIGRQKEDFLQKLDRETEGDVYLMGVQYLLEPYTTVRKMLLERMTQTIYQSTEEAMFVLSLYAAPKEGFEAMRPQLSRLWGTGRSIPLEKNIALLEWLVVNGEEAIKECRKKDNAVLRALTKLPYMFIKEDSPVFSVLTETGYSKQEIALANSQLIWTPEIRDRLPFDGIPAEKIAAECCITCLNNPNELDGEICAYLEWLLRKYEKFSIKYQGHQGIWEAIKDALHPVQPQTVLWMNSHIQADFPYRFDVFDAQWDVLARELDTKKYQELFTDQMLAQEEISEANLRKWLAHYQELTGFDYLTYFQDYHTTAGKSFALLVEKGVLSLWTFFQEHVSDEQKENDHREELYHLKNYVDGAKSREAFDFLCKLLEGYTVVGLRRIFGSGYRFHAAFLEHIGRYYSRGEARIDIRRPFLTAEEERQLLEWIDESVFKTEPADYLDFVKTALKDGCVQEIYRREELSQVLRQLISADEIAQYEAAPLKEKFYTPEELSSDQETLKAIAAQEAQREEEEKWEEKRKKLKKLYDGSFQSLQKYAKEYYWDQDKKDALSLIYDQLADAVSRCVRPAPAKQMGAFLQLCGSILKRNALPWEQIAPLLTNMTEEGIQC